MLKIRLFELFENTVSCSFDDDGGETTIYLYVLYVAFRGGKSVKWCHIQRPFWSETSIELRLAF